MFDPLRSETALCGMPLAHVDTGGSVSRILSGLAAGRGGWVVTANLDILRRWARDAAFRRVTEPVTFFVADGMPLVWAARLQGRPLPERVTGADLVGHLAEAAAAAGRSLYLLGGAPGTANRTAMRLEAQYPGLRIAGTSCPAPGFESDSATWQRLVADVVAARPDIVLVALGSPKQDRVIATLRPYLPRTWWMGVGAAFGFASGELRRAPLWMQRLGLEWFYRLWQEPRRLARRYLLEDLPFCLRLFGDAWRHRRALK